MHLTKPKNVHGGEGGGKGSFLHFFISSMPSSYAGICQLFEQKLKMDHPNTRNITYDVSDLFRYIDSLADLSALVYNSQIRAYEPYNKDWIKNRVFAHLKKQAQN